MQPCCPNCERTIPAEDVNVGRDVAFCRSCNEGHPLSEMVHEVDVTAVDLGLPPRGCWIERHGFEKEIGASYRSLGMMVGTLAISLFWNGITSVFVLINLSSSLNLAGVEVPEWFPAPEMNDQTMGLGMTLFLWLFLTPFILIGSAMIGAFLMSLGGKTVVRLTPTEGSIFTGIGPIGWRRRFQPQEVVSIRAQESSSSNDNSSSSEIVLDLGSREMKFASTLPTKRQAFLVAALRRELR